MKGLLRDIEEETRLAAGYTGRETLNPRVLAAIVEVPRERFVPARLRHAAFDNAPLPIGEGQTISQPFMVALMTDLLDLAPDAVVLEIGTGSGYQAAVLSCLVHQVYSIERVPRLAADAAARLAELGYGNVAVREGDGYAGWPEHAPYDGIIVTAAAPHVPPPLVEQLKPGGRLVIPLGEPYFGQELRVLTRDEAGHVSTRHVLPVAFVPLVREGDVD
ncbi:MAG: protein-L-isoaspartate(D-aspartate) O-methyltransferase [Gammaproteobacteria bacterium]|nr:protein-L-isoaspartate(D-aspartate) O-methyltransferase [Gammaproteobacteria bacterium]